MLVAAQASHSARHRFLACDSLARTLANPMGLRTQREGTCSAREDEPESARGKLRSLYVCLQQRSKLIKQIASHPCVVAVAF
jgi:hypothetical protein